MNVSKMAKQAANTALPDIFHRTCVRNPSVGESVEPSATFSVVSYNILAECHRLPALKQLGYEGYYIKRTQEHFNEGEATFVRSERFHVESWAAVSLTEKIKEDISKHDLEEPVKSAIIDYTDRSDVISICKLKDRRTKRGITLGNVHIVWGDLECIDVQALQIAVAVKELVHQAGSDSSPHILCGDFNSAPSSVGYQLAKDGYLSDANIATLQAVENLKLNTGSKALVDYLPKMFIHPGKLRSSYRTCLGKEPDVTCYDKVSWGCLDYVFYGGDSLHVKSVLNVVDKASLEEGPGIPNNYHSSDHLSLKTTFYMDSSQMSS